MHSKGVEEQGEPRWEVTAHGGAGGTKWVLNKGPLETLCKGLPKGLACQP
jgi:hypothetical protein